MVNLLMVIDKDGNVHNNVNQKIFTSPEAAVASFGFATIEEMQMAQADATRKIASQSESGKSAVA